MPYYSHTFTAPLPRHYARILIYDIRAHAHARTIYAHAYTHTQLHVYTHAFNIYKVLLVELSCENI